MPKETNVDFATRRAELVASLARQGIDDPDVLAAIGRVPREAFVAPEHRAHAYANVPLPIGQGQTISQPLMIALMLQALAVRPGQRVLEVGTGSGYQATLLAALGAEVVTIERHADLAAQARHRLEQLGYTAVEVVVGDGSLGWPPRAPYERIIVAAAAPQPPAPLLQQLADGGRLVIPTGSRERQTLQVIDREGEHWRRRAAGACRFVPLVGAAGWPEVESNGEPPAGTPRWSPNGSKPRR